MKKNRSRRAISRTSAIVICLLFIMGLGLGVGSLYTINNISHENTGTTSTTTTTTSFVSKSSSGSQTTPGTGTGSILASCSPNPVDIGVRTTCSVSISGLGSPVSGTISWGSNQSGSFSSNTCNPASGSCSVDYTPLNAGDAKISANLSGNQNGAHGYGVDDLLVMKESTLTFLSCAPIVAIGNSSPCAVTVVGYGTPTGNVSFVATGSGHFDQNSCVVRSGGTCNVDYTPTGVSFTPQNITASYGGDSNNRASVSAPYPLSIGAQTSSTKITCSPMSITVGSSSTCTVTVTGYSPTGMVNITSSDSGARISPSSLCTLVSGSCSSVMYTPSRVGAPRIFASYLGDSNNSPSLGSSNITVGIASSHVSVACSPSSVVVGIATVCKTTVGGYNPSGIVNWTSSPIGTFRPDSCRLLSGSCSVNYTAQTNVSPISIQVAYAGDSANTPGSASFDLIVGASSTTVSVNCSPSTVTIGSTGSCNIIVFGFGSPNGTVSFQSTDSGANFSPSPCTLSPLRSSSSSCQTTYTPFIVGSATITATYSGDKDNSAGSGNTAITVGMTTSSVSVSCSPNSVVIGGQTKCNASVQGYNPSGSVSWSSSSSGSFTPSNSCSLASGSCSVTFTALSPGSPVTIQGTYGGDSNNNGASNTFGLTVTTSSSTTSVSCAPNPLRIDSSATCTATVTGYSQATGVVSFSSTDLSSNFVPSSCNLATSGGTTSCSVTYNPSAAGQAKITAQYSGDSNNAASFGSFQLTVTLVSTTTSISCNPVAIGSTSTCNVSVTGDNPTGSVTLSSSDSSATFTSCNLASGSCSVTYTPSVAGSATINANYPGDSLNSPSSGNTNLNVGKASSSVQVVCSQPIMNGTSTQCTVTVSGYNPSGTVSWQSNGNGTLSSNSCTLSGGMCMITYTATGDSPGATVTITANYSGDVNNPAGTANYGVNIT